MLLRPARLAPSTPCVLNPLATIHTHRCRLLCIFGPGGEHIHTLTAAGDAVQQLLWVGDTQIAAASGSQVSLWSIAADQYTEVGTFMANPAATVQRVAASGNGRYLAAALDNDTVQVRPLGGRVCVVVRGGGGGG